MRRFLAARAGVSAACVLLLLPLLVRPAGGQTWNDPRSRSIVEGATQRRAEQLADTALRDYQATAHGYVAFLAQLGEGFRTPPKVLKADELEDEVYWRAPNLSKQRIVARRDTLLLPTDIAYHTDHLGIVQNNFPDIIRIGDGGDEVADVPHPLSRIGLDAYDFALTDSFSIGSATQRIHVYEVKFKPKDDTKPRLVGAVYIDPASRQVVRMNLTFTRAAFLDKALENLSLVLENRLVSGRFWLPSRQQIEISRKGEWLDYPARGIIRGWWQIGDYKFNQSPSTFIFTGPEISQAPPSVLAQHHWEGRIIDSLPADIRAVSEPDIQRVQEEARVLVRAQALATAKRATLSGRKVEDFVRFDRVEGIAAGTGLQKQLGGGWSANVRARYGIDDKQVKGAVELSELDPGGSVFRLFAARDFRDVGDVAERSSAVNSLAAQEFGSDYTDPYLVRTVGMRLDLALEIGFDVRVGVEHEWESPLQVHARPVTGVFEPTLAALGLEDRHASRLVLDVNRPLSPWMGGETDVAIHAEARARLPVGAEQPGQSPRDASSFRGFGSINVERPVKTLRLVTSLTAAVVHVAKAGVPISSTELVYLGGPVSAPGYAYHSLVSSSGYTGHVELRVPAPFPSFGLGRYGRVPGRGTVAPYVHVAGVGNSPFICVPATASSSVANVIRPGSRVSCEETPGRFLPTLGAAFLTPFDLIRFDVAKGLGRTGGWMFSVDVTREFWSIL